VVASAVGKVPRSSGPASAVLVGGRTGGTWRPRLRRAARRVARRLTGRCLRDIARGKLVPPCDGPVAADGAGHDSLCLRDHGPACLTGWWGWIPKNRPWAPSCDRAPPATCRDPTRRPGLLAPPGHKAALLGFKGSPAWRPGTSAGSSRSDALGLLRPKGEYPSLRYAVASRYARGNGSSPP
jgi:hypothetical protein